MQIDSIDVQHIALPLRKPLSTPLGPREKLETVIVAMRSGDATGWGEASPGVAPLAAAEWAAGAFAVLRDWLAPAVVGHSFSSGEEFSAALATFRGNQFAKAALDTAWWDLDARLQNRPLHAVLGGKRDAIEVGPTFDRMESIDEFMALLAAAVAAGFDRLKLKFRPGWDVRMVDFVRKECPTQALHVDCEGGLHLGQMEMLYRLEDFALAMIEQPFSPDDLVGHAMAQESLRTPIGLDEAIASFGQAEMAMELKSCKYVSLKPGRVGGLTPAVAIHDLCHDNCTPCFVGAMPQSAIGSRISFALAAKENCTYPSDFFPSDQILAEDLAEPLLPTRDDSDGRQRVRLWSEPGIGVEPDAALLEKFCIARVKIP
jgi:o-succinylbenzoate synthase